MTDPSPISTVQRRIERISQAVIRIPVADASSGFDEIRALLLGWLREKAGEDLPEAMQRGETCALDLIGAQRTETVALEEPRYWAARQDDQDRTLARRTWVTEVMLAEAGANSLSLGFRLHCVTRGDPALFARSVPRFFREVGRTQEVWMDDVEADVHASPVETEEEVDALVRLLTDTRRRAPVVGVSVDGDDLQVNRALIDADRLADEVFGTAHVRLLSRSAAFVLTRRIGKRLSVFHGAVRIWFPVLRPDHDDPYDHPLLLSDRILDDGPERTRRNLIDRLLRASVSWRGSEQAIPSFADVRRAASMLLRDEAAQVGRPTDELLELYQAENERLTEEIKEMKAEDEQLMALADEEIQTLRSERDKSLQEIRTLNARLNTMHAALRKRDDQPEVTIPDDFENLGGWASIYLGDRVELLPRALGAAKKSEFGNPALAYQALLLMHDTYVPMRQSGSLVLKERWETGLRQLSLECGPTHSGSGAGEFGSDYFVTYRGHRRELDFHLKGSNSRDPRYCFRLYFLWDDDAKRAVVGWLPSHLESRIT